jgi:hypothetical protein
MMGKRRSETATVAAADDRPAPRSSLPVDPDRTHQQVRAMIRPSDNELSRPLAVRDGQGAPVTCSACGCRLAKTGDAWFHFHPMGGRDARGCRIACADAAHDASGRPVSLAV